MIPKEGEIIKIKVNGLSYDTVVANNVQRFPVNQLIRHLVDTKQVDLNNLCIDYQKGKFTLEEYQQFYMGMGYSVCGFEEIFGVNSGFLAKKDKAEIENPLWD